MAETLIDPELFSGAVYKASNWLFVGRTRGFARQKNGYAEPVESSKLAPFASIGQLKMAVITFWIGTTMRTDAE